MANEIKIEFKNGKKIVRHPSGIVNEYTLEDLIGYKTQLIEQRQKINQEIINIDKDLASITASRL